jgi:pyruvate dehydrogenase E2 component (dihydrolipoamide acetyltransferase)
MSQLIEVKVPDIGDFDAVPVIELFVKVGDTIAVDDAIATLESDKATMDIPSSHAGVVKEVLIAVGDKVAEGAVLIKLEAAATAGAAAAAPAASAPAAAAAPAAPPAPAAAPAAAASAPAAPAAGGGMVEVKVPDIGDFDAVVSASTAAAPAALAPALPARFQGSRLAVRPGLCPRTRRRSGQGCRPPARRTASSRKT